MMLTHPDHICIAVKLISCHALDDIINHKFHSFNTWNHIEAITYQIIVLNSVSHEQYRFEMIQTYIKLPQRNIKA